MASRGTFLTLSEFRKKSVPSLLDVSSRRFALCALHCSLCQSICLMVFWTAGDVDEITIFGKVTKSYTCELCATVREQLVGNSIDREMPFQLVNDTL